MNFNFEQQIEAHIFTVLTTQQTQYGVNQFYATITAEDLLQSIQQKANTNDAIFYRVTGSDFADVSTLGDTEVGTVTIEVMVATPRVMKQQQIRNEPRHVNTIAAFVIEKLKENPVELEDETTHEFILRGVRDFVTTPDLDVRTLTFNLVGVVIDA